MLDGSSAGLNGKLQIGMENTMKHTNHLGVSLAALMAVTLAGAAQAQELSGTLTGIFDSNYKTMLDQVIARFNEKHPGVKVEINYVGADMNGLLSTLLQSNTAPDILVSYPGGEPNDSADLNVITMASQSKLLDLSDAEWTGKIPDAWKSEVAYEGKVFAYPGAVQPLTAIYNKDTLDKLGLKAPETLDAVLQLCADAKAAGVYAYAQGLGDTQAGPQMLSFAQTATLVYGPDPDFKKKLDDKSATFQGSGWERQFEIYKQMYDAGCFGEGALGLTRQQGAEAVAGGLALAQVDVGSQKRIMQDIAPDAHFLVTGIPATNDGKTFVTALPGYTVAVNAQAKNPEAAKAFLAELASPESSILYANAFASVPIIPNDKFVAPADLEGFAALVASGNYAKLANLGASTVQQQLNDGVQSLLLGGDTPKSAAEKMQAAFDAL
jgi:raffinose/stachyose/melibiose transport system substrate-binding protein